MSEPTGMTAGSDFMGIVLMSTVAAIDGCPWVQKDKTVEIAEAVAEMVADAVAEVDSFILPNGEHWRREQR